jgi:5-methylcytosine-specific restriction protein B
MDWAASIKFAPLFDTDTISPAQLRDYADQWQAPFNRLMRIELLKIVAAGLYFVD